MGKIIYIYKMRIIAKSTLKKFWEVRKYRDAEQSLRAWYDEVKNAEWNTLNEIKQKYRNCSIVGNDRIVFNIKGNKYRLVVAFRFKPGRIAFVKFIGTHKEYDKTNVKEIGK